MTWLIFIGTLMLGSILIGAGAFAVDYASKGGFERRLVGILVCFLAGGAAIGLGYWEVFIGRTSEGWVNGQYGLITHTYPITGWICLLGGSIGTIVCIILAASRKKY